MNMAISAARASYDEGNWCGTPPGPRPHFDLGTSQLTKLEQLLGGALGGSRQSEDDAPQCGNGILNLLKHFPPPPPPQLGDLVGGAAQQVMNALMR
jgi:hypothetical protein